MPVAARKSMWYHSSAYSWATGKEICPMLHFSERQCLEGRSLAFQRHLIRFSSLLKGRQWREPAHCLPSRHSAQDGGCATEAILVVCVDLGCHTLCSCLGHSLLGSS